MRNWLAVLQKPRLMPAVGIAVACCAWLLDAVVDHFLFKAGAPFMESLLPDEPQELWMRLLIVVLFVAVSWYARVLLGKEAHAREALAGHQSELEDIIVARTQALEENNRALQKEMAERQRVQGQLEMLATTDPLTGLYNRRKFEELLNHELERCHQYAGEFALILFDVDHFKQINDQHGHDVGDDVLRFLADIIRSQVRKSDTVARWGGEEFVALVSGADKDAALVIADKLRRLVEAGQYPRQQRVTISLGIALGRRDDSAASLIRRADQALYRAKSSGRNCAILESPVSPQEITRTPQ